MEVKSIRDCLNIIDGVVVENIGKYTGILILEIIHEHFLEKGQKDFIEKMTALSNVPSQINCIIENHNIFTEEDIKSEYIQLRKLILAWLIECSTKFQYKTRKI